MNALFFYQFFILFKKKPLILKIIEERKNPFKREKITLADYLELLKNNIDIREVPFSDRGSRLLVYQSAHKHCLYIKLAERLYFLDSQIESYLKRPAIYPWTLPVRSEWR